MVSIGGGDVSKGKAKKIIPKIKKNNSQKKYPSKKQGTILTGQIGL